MYPFSLSAFSLQTQDWQVPIPQPMWRSRDTWQSIPRSRQVYAIAGNSFHVKEDYASILLQYDAKRSGTVETNWLTPYKMRTLTATGTGGVASADYLTQSLELWKEEGRITVEIDKDEPLKIELAQFVDAISNGHEPSPSGEEGQYVLSVAIAAIESYQKGNNVHLDA